MCILLATAPPSSSDLALPAREELGLDGWSYQLFGSAAALRRAWPGEYGDGQFWLHPATLAFLNAHPQGVETDAVLLHGPGKARVALTVQRFAFNAAGQVKKTAGSTGSRLALRRRLLAPFSFGVLVLGQMLTSAGHTQAGLKNLAPASAVALIDALSDRLSQRYGGIAATLVKDLFTAEHPAVALLEQRGFFGLPSDPVMELAVPEDWAGTEDYLAALTSKYRVRYRRARGKLAGIERRRLPAGEVAARRGEIYRLYQSTSSGADFNAVALTEDYFPWLAYAGQRPGARPQVPALLGKGGFNRSQRKSSAELDLREVSKSKASGAAVETESYGSTTFAGYFDGQRLVGFTTLIDDGPTWHAHFLGMEDRYKYSHHLYHNMLFDLLETAIAGGARTLDFGRTALEIKSSVGALPYPYALHLRARNSILNGLIPRFTPAVYRSPEWTLRNPFRGG